MSEEDRFEKVFKGLGTVETPDGLEQRVLAAMARAERQQAWHGGSGWLRPVGWRAGVAAVLALLGIGISPRPRHSEPGSAKIAGTMTSSIVPPAPDLSADLRQHPAVPHHRLVKAMSGPAEQPETFGYPPPPLPLTPQEKLMLQIIHRGDPDEVAALDPAVREASIYEEHAQFEEFFFPASASGTSASEAPTEPATVPPAAAPEGDKR